MMYYKRKNSKLCRECGRDLGHLAQRLFIHPGECKKKRQRRQMQEACRRWYRANRFRKMNYQVERYRRKKDARVRSAPNRQG